jgi:hypothetical protein
MKVPPPVEARWKPGQSGNPGGRPKTHLLSEAFREALAEVDPKSQETYAIAIARKIVHLAADKRTKLSSSLIMAIAEMADRTEGKPKQHIEQEITEHVDPETRTKRIVELLAEGIKQSSTVLTADPEDRTRKPS